MTKGDIYALPRKAVRREKHEYARAMELFASTGQYTGDPVLVAYIVTCCFERGVPFKWDLGELGSGENTRVSRAR